MIVTAKIRFRLLNLTLAHRTRLVSAIDTERRLDNILR